jgi:hypothetical protein
VKKPWRRLLAVTIAGVAVFAAFSIYADVSELGDRLSGFGWWAMAAALGLAVANYAIRLVRWELYLRVAGLHVRPATSALVFVSGFALSITPGKLGELIKSFLCADRRHPDHPDRTDRHRRASHRSDRPAALGTAGVAAYGIGRGMVLPAPRWSPPGCWWSGRGSPTASSARSAAGAQRRPTPAGAVRRAGLPVRPTA